MFLTIFSYEHGANNINYSAINNLYGSIFLIFNDIIVITTIDNNTIIIGEITIKSIGKFKLQFIIPKPSIATVNIGLGNSLL